MQTIIVLENSPGDLRHTIRTRRLTGLTDMLLS